uniref:Uncharacterized protein n=1 Tax=Panagrolaimus sp. ES5 TaxID=591445 RepID=A0AC34GJ55_9BILA
GDEEKAAVIREKINVHHYNENSESLFPIDREIEGKSIFSQTITEAHLQSLAKWFECRIGIFFEGKWTKYGNWTLAGIPTLLMERKDGKYAPILSLK